MTWEGAGTFQSKHGRPQGLKHQQSMEGRGSALHGSVRVKSLGPLSQKLASSDRQFRNDKPEQGLQGERKPI